MENLIFLFPSQVGGVCKLSTESSLRRCRTPDGKICSGRGKCNCGICICEAIEPGKFFGPRCECHDWVCATYNGKTCNGAYDPVLISKVSNVAILPKLLASQRHRHRHSISFGTCFSALFDTAIVKLDSVTCHY